MPEAQRARVRRTITDGGLRLCCLDTSFEIARPEESLGEALACVELAAELGAPMIRLFAGPPEDEPWDTTVARTTERATALADLGRSLGVTIAVETHDRFAAGTVLAEALRPAPADVGIVWDTLNALVAGEPAELTFASVRDRLVHVHIKDGAVPPEVDENRLLGDGRVPIRSIVEMVAAAGYEGWLSVEWEKLWQPWIPDADVALPRYLDGLRAILDDLV
jgi:sugar phosphate isomerase/epimerase